MLVALASKPNLVQVAAEGDVADFNTVSEQVIQQGLFGRDRVVRDQLGVNRTGKKQGRNHHGQPLHEVCRQGIQHGGNRKLTQ